MDLNDMKVRRDAVLDDAKKIVGTAETEDRNLTTEEREKYDALMTEAADLHSRIERQTEIDLAAGLCSAETEHVGEDPSIGMTKDEVREFSMRKAIIAAADGDWSNAGLEREASEAARDDGTDHRGSFTIPYDVLVDKRDMTIGTATGDKLVATDLLAGSFIDLLRNRLVVRQAGARFMPGLVGNVAIPKRTTGTTAYWVAEDGAPTESQSVFAQVTMTPKTVAAYEDISRQLLLQSTPAAEQLIRDDIVQTLGLAIDLAALHGTGTNQPTGIAATSGIGSVVGGTNGAAPDWADMVALETEVAQDNADIGSMAYVTSAKVRGKLKSTAKVSSSDSVMVWESNNTPINGYPAYVSNQVSDTLTKGTSTAKCSAIFFGNWNDLLIGMWGGLDVLVDPYTASTTGKLRIVAFQSIDLAVRHAESFAAMLDALTA